MKTISTHININNNGINQPITTKKSYRNHKYYQNYDQAAGDINRNATIAQLEYERNACEEELYRLRYGIENLLANNEQGDFKVRQRQRFTNIQNPFTTMTSNRRNKSWLDQCSPCCRRWRRYICDDNVHIPNEYTYRRVYNDRNYDRPLHRTPESPFQSQLYSDSYVSTSPSPSISSHYIDSNMSYTKNDLRHNIDNLINRNSPIKTNVLDLITSKDMNDSVYNSLILKILEAKALDCLCTGYSKQNTQKQITKALTEINQRFGEHQLDSSSVTSSSQLSPTSYESSSVSSILTDHESLTPHSITPQQSNQEIISPSPSSIQTPNITQTTSTLISPDNNKHKIKSSLKLNENIKSPKKKSKVTIVTDKISQSNKSKNKKKPSSKHSKKPKKTSTKHKNPTKKLSKSKISLKKHTSSKLKKHKSSSKSPSKSKTNTKKQSKHKISSRKKSTKPKSNNQINDYQADMLTTFIYPQSYQEVYRNRQRLLKLLLSST